MRAKSSIRGIDHAIARLASAQFGVVSRVQLLALGLTSAAISRRVGAGLLHPLHAGVYAVGHRTRAREGRWMAAVLACGGAALLSHRSAASLWRIRMAEGPLPDVTVPGTRQRRRPGVAVHRAHLLPADTRRWQGIPVTSPARTLVDLAHEVDRADLVRALREMQFLRLFQFADVQMALERRPSHDLRMLIEDLVLSQSGLEDRFLALCDRHRIPRPRTQQPLAGRRMDFVWHRERLVVETDGWQAHGTRSAFQADRTASNALQLEGYLVLRFTDADLRRRPAHVARQIRSALTRLRTSDE